MIEQGGVLAGPGEARTAAERPWSGGRPWTAPAPLVASVVDARPGTAGARLLALRPGPAAVEEVEPRPELAGTGADLAVALAQIDLDGPELTCVGVQARAHLVDVAVAAERVVAWASSVQARAVAALHRQFVAEHDLDQDELADQLAGTGDPVAKQPAADHPVTGHRARGGRVSEELAVFHSAGRASAVCLSLALGVSARSADRLLALALGLAEVPDLADALAQGRVDVAQARVIQESTTALAPTQRTDLVARLVSDPEDPDAARTLVPELREAATPIWGVPGHRLRPIIAREIAALAPEAVEDAEQVAERGRRVAYYPPSPEHSGALVLHGPAPQLAAVYDRLDAGARAARQAGAPQTLDQLRYDLAVGALTDGTFGLTLTHHPPPSQNHQPSNHPSDQPRSRTQPEDGTASRTRIGIDIIVAADTLLGLDQRPATLRTAAGDVPISATAARRLAHDQDATWRRILTDPATGIATDVSPRYRPARRVADYVTIRDGHTSRFPTSGARHLELDHILEYDHHNPARGGPTTPANLASNGKRDHQAKTDHLLTVTGNANQVLTYRTGAGHTYPSRPHPYTEPRPPDDSAPPY